MIAVVTGGSGFIGRNLVQRLLADGHEVRCLMRPNGGTPPAGTKRYVVHYDEPRSLTDCPAFEDARVVFHLAGATNAATADAFLAANVTPTRNLLGALAARRLYTKFILISSQAAAGPSPSRDRAVEEGDQPHPVEPYGRSKLEAERVAQSFAKRLPITIVRPCSVFGPHDQAFLTLFRMADRGTILYPGIAEHWASVVHVDDVVSGLLAAARRETSICRTYFLAGAEPVRWRVLGEMIATIMERQVRHLDLPASLVQAGAAAGEWFSRIVGRVTRATTSRATLARQPFWVCSAQRARDELGFRETCSLPEALRQTYLWYRGSGWLPRAARSAAHVVV